MSGFIKRLGLLVLVFLGLTTLISEGSLYFLRHSSFYKPAYVANSLDRETFDYVVLGSSIGLTTLNTNAIDSLCGLHGVNLSMDDTGIETHCLMLEHFLAEGKTTTYCILSTSAASLNSKSSGMSTNDYRFLPYVRRDYVSSYFESQKAWESKIILYSRFFSFIGVSYYNTEIFYPSLLGMTQPKKRNRFDAQGNYSYPALSHGQKKVIEVKKLDVHLQNPSFKRLDSICKSNNINLIVYVPPMENTIVEIRDHYVPLINHSDLLKDPSLFYDAIHVNVLGREESSLQFSKDFSLIVRGGNWKLEVEYEDN